MAQELCRHLQRCLKHEDVARQLILRDLNPACEQWACGSLQALTEDMELWKCDLTLGNRWARVAKCMQLLSIPVELAEDAYEDNERRGASLTSTTRELRRLRHRLRRGARPSRFRYPFRRVVPRCEKTWHCLPEGLLTSP